MLIEDVACPVEQLPDMMIDLIAMFKKYGYADASCFGHALEGNLHLVFSQGFRTDAEVERFTNMFEELCYIVATKHSGSLKGARCCPRFPCVTSVSSVSSFLVNFLVVRAVSGHCRTAWQWRSRWRTKG